MRKSAQFPPTLNLYQADGHASLKVLSIQGGWGTRRCFNQMGIQAGDRVRVLWKAPFGGALVIENRGTHLAVSKQLAEKIKVEVLP